jgi:ATP-dependent DNA helicase 2 subunit 1
VLSLSSLVSPIRDLPLQSLADWTQTAYVDTRTGRLLAQQDLKSSYEYGGEKVIFSREEVARIKQLQPPGMRLLGFKPRACLKDKDNIRPSLFVYPDEETIRGSRLAFAALYRKMVRRV